MDTASFQELTGWFRLALTSGVGDLTARRLLAAFGLPEMVFAQSAANLRQVVSAAQVAALQNTPSEWAQTCDQVQRWLDTSPSHRLITLADQEYPPELLEMADPPLMLYLLGDSSLLQHRLKVSVVGSRNPTPQGALNARDMSHALAGAGVCVVSGLALGVDGAAHEGALEAGGSTIAVVGTGLDRVYPRRNLQLARRIAEAGLLVSEFPLGTSPLAANFPKRNRIIAGLGQGTLVVEAALASGSLITAKLAADMGREVFAIPGSIHSPQAKGCHALIRQGAKLVETAQDVLEDLKMGVGANLDPGKQKTDDPFSDEVTQVDIGAPQGRVEMDGSTLLGCSTDAKMVLRALGFEALGLDAIQARTALPTPQLQAVLLELELDGHLSRMPGGQFQRLFSA